MEYNKVLQETLRQDLISEVKKYLAYADDVHFDNIFVDESTLEVGYCSRNDDTRRPNCEYYSILSLMEPTGMWFQPDLKAIEAIVQEHVPSPEVKIFINNAVECITKFLIENRPSNLATCKLSIGDITHRMNCFDELEVDDDDEEIIDEELEEDEDCWSYSFESLRGIVRKTTSGYDISTYKLAKVALEHIQI